MILQLLLACFIAQATSNPQSPTVLAPQTAKTAQDAGDVDDPVALLKVKRIYVDSFGEDIVSKELQSMIVSSLVSTKRFKVTENKERADAVLKGVALEKSSQELHAFGESTTVGAAAGGSSSAISGSVVNGNGSVSGSSSGGFTARKMGTSDSSVNTETIDRARISIRLVNPGGDVIWTTTQESKGAKYKGASADVADLCVKQLLRDISKLEGPGSSSGSTPSDQH